MLENGKESEGRGRIEREKALLTGGRGIEVHMGHTGMLQAEKPSSPKEKDKRNEREKREAKRVRGRQVCVQWRRQACRKRGKKRVRGEKEEKERK